MTDDHLPASLFVKALGHRQPLKINNSKNLPLVLLVQNHDSRMKQFDKTAIHRIFEEEESFRFQLHVGIDVFRNRVLMPGIFPDLAVKPIIVVVIQIFVLLYPFLKLLFF